MTGGRGVVMVKRITLVIILMLIIIFGIVPSAGAEAYYRGIIMSVDNYQPDNRFITLEQEAHVLIRSGPYRGEKITIKNDYVEEDIYRNIYLERVWKSS